MSIRYLGCVLFPVLWLAGCSEPGSNSGAVNVEQSKPTEQPETTAKPSTPSAHVVEQQDQPLDLSIDKLPVAADTDDQNISNAFEKHTLANMFEKNKKEKKTSLSAGVLTEEENKDYLDSINGAEVSVEMKLP